MPEHDEFGLAGESGLQEGVEDADELEVLGVAGSGFRAGVNGTAFSSPEPVRIRGRARSYTADWRLVARCGIRRACGLTPRYPVERPPPTLGATQRA